MTGRYHREKSGPRVVATVTAAIFFFLLGVAIIFEYQFCSERIFLQIQLIFTSKLEFLCNKITIDDDKLSISVVKKKANWLFTANSAD